MNPSSARLYDKYKYYLNEFNKKDQLERRGTDQVYDIKIFQGISENNYSSDGRYCNEQYEDCVEFRDDGFELCSYDNRTERTCTSDSDFSNGGYSEVYTCSDDESDEESEDYFTANEIDEMI